MGSVWPSLLLGWNCRVNQQTVHHMVRILCLHSVFSSLPGTYLLLYYMSLFCKYCFVQSIVSNFHLLVLSLLPYHAWYKSVLLLQLLSSYVACTCTYYIRFLIYLLNGISSILKFTRNSFTRKLYAYAKKCFKLNFAFYYLFSFLSHISNTVLLNWKYPITFFCLQTVHQLLLSSVKSLFLGPPACINHVRYYFFQTVPRNR